jgi:hypothetical protein
MYAELKDFGYLMMWGVVIILLTWAIFTYITGYTIGAISITGVVDQLAGKPQ